MAPSEVRDGSPLRALREGPLDPREGVDDIPDPYRQPQEVFDAMAAEVDAAVQGIVDVERMFT